jgi:nitrite reductase/ring-hydroxylating ferredoxin subunit
MDGFVKIASATDIPPGTKKTVFGAGAKIALSNVDGEFFAVADTCTHEECSLGSEGFLDGNTLVCGCHGSIFDVTTGKVLTLPAVTDLQSYPVKVENGEVFVKI